METQPALAPKSPSKLSRIKASPRSRAWLLIGDSAALNAAGRITGIDPGSLPCTLIETGALAADHVIGFGQLRAEYGAAAIAYVRRAVELCMSGEADAMVTAPLNKEAVTLSGQAFTGTPNTLPS